MLSGDIKILNCNIDLKGRIEICDGVDVARNLYQGYEDEAFIPRLPWRKPSKNELDYIIDKDNLNIEDYNKYVSIIGIDSFVCSILRKNYLNQFSLNEDLSASIYIEQILEDINKYCTSKNITFAGIIKSLVKVPTTTVDKKLGLYIGLHLDSWDRLRISERENSSNRISVNLGDDERYFIFFDQSISNIARIMNVTDKTNPNINKLVYSFIKANMSYPIIKIRINPFEAYIAPTENLIHDGWISGNSREDITCIFRGVFKLKPKNKF